MIQIFIPMEGVMPKRKRGASPKIVIESSFNESQVEKDVSNYLGSFSDGSERLRLLDADEKLTGADAKLNWKGRLLFFQFKAPKGLTPLKERKPKSTQPAREIRRYRFENDLQQEPYSVYFQLRALAKHAKDYQHNILLSYQNPPHSRACYVCPTILKLRDYGDRFFESRRFSLEPFLFGIHRYSVARTARAVAFVPFLRAHASIIPHARVDTHNHHYSFSVHGGDVAFHSPEIVSREVFRLSDVVSSEILAVYQNIQGSLGLDELADTAFDIAQKWLNGRLRKPARGTGFDWLRDHGKLLHEDFAIKQFLVLVAPQQE